jgi:hypothetical protein
MKDHGKKRKVARQVPTIKNESAYRDTRAHYLFRLRKTDDGQPIDANTRFINLMHNAYDSITRSGSVKPVQKAVLVDETQPNALFNNNSMMITAYSFDWNREIKTNREFHATMWYINKMLHKADRVSDIVNPYLKQQMDFGQNKTDLSTNTSIDLMDYAAMMEKSCPLLAEEMIQRLNVHNGNRRLGRSLYMYSEEGLQNLGSTTPRLPGKKATFEAK